MGAFNSIPQKPAHVTEKRKRSDDDQAYEPLTKKPCLDPVSLSQEELENIPLMSIEVDDDDWYTPVIEPDFEDLSSTSDSDSDSSRSASPADNSDQKESDSDNDDSSSDNTDNEDCDSDAMTESTVEDDVDPFQTIQEIKGLAKLSFKHSRSITKCVDRMYLGDDVREEMIAKAFAIMNASRYLFQDAERVELEFALQ
ncbi:hypothetical protein ACLX1H_010090 [Fusarium chlamydosporum]